MSSSLIEWKNGMRLCMLPSTFISPIEVTYIGEGSFQTDNGKVARFNQSLFPYVNNKKPIFITFDGSIKGEMCDIIKVL